MATRVSGVGPQFTKRLSDVGPWFTKTRWGKWHGRINGGIILAVLLFILWKSFF